MTPRADIDARRHQRAIGSAASPPRSTLAPGLSSSLLPGSIGVNDRRRAPYRFSFRPLCISASAVTTFAALIDRRTALDAVTLLDRAVGHGAVRPASHGRSPSPVRACDFGKNRAPRRPELPSALRHAPSTPTNDARLDVGERRLDHGDDLDVVGQFDLQRRRFARFDRQHRGRRRSRPCRARARSAAAAPTRSAANASSDRDECDAACKHVRSSASHRRRDVAADIHDLGQHRAVRLLVRAENDDLRAGLEFVSCCPARPRRSPSRGVTMIFFSPSLYFTISVSPSLPATMFST